MGAQLSSVGVAGPIETFSRGDDPSGLINAADSELDNLQGALNVAYGPEAGISLQTNDALAWLRQWRDNCITGPDRHTLLPCLMERAFLRASGNDPATVEVKFLCTLCPAWARQILPEAMSETGTVAGWAAAGAAACTYTSRPCTRQFVSLLAVATMLASADHAANANPMEKVHDLLAAALGTIGDEAGVLALLEGLHALVTESMNQKLKLPGETRYLVRRSMLTRVVTVLETIDGFLHCLPEESVSGAALESASDLMARCIGLATTNVATATGTQFILQPELLAALPHSLLFAKVVSFIGNANEGSATRTCAEFLSAVAELSSTPDSETYVALNQTIGAASNFLQCLLRDPLAFDDVDCSSVVNIVTTYADLLLVTASNRVTVTDNSDASHYILDELLNAVLLVSRIPSADTDKSSAAHGCLAIVARSLHPVTIPVLESGDAADTYAELQQADLERSRAVEVLMQPLLLPCLDQLLTFEITNDPEWDEASELLISRRSVRIARQWCGAGEEALTKAQLGAIEDQQELALQQDEDDDDTRMISVIGGDACGNYAAAVSAVTRLVGKAPVAADGWFPLAVAHGTYDDHTTIDYVHSQAGSIRFNSSHDAFLIACANAALHGRDVDMEALRRVALDALAAAEEVRSISFLTAAYSLTTVVVQGLSQQGHTDLRDVAAALMHSRLALTKRAPLPRTSDATGLTAVNAHVAFRLAANRVIMETMAAGGAMAPISAVLTPASPDEAGKGWMALVIDSARVVLSVVQALGPACRSNSAVITGFRDTVFLPTLIQGQLSAWYANIASLRNESQITTAKQLAVEFATVFNMLCEAFAPAPHEFFQGTDPSSVEAQVAALCNCGAASIAVKIVGPLVELAPEALGALPTQVFQHVESYLPHIADGHEALDVAAAMCRAFAAIAERPVAASTITPECASTIHNAAAVVLLALANSRPSSELAVDWPEFNVWIDQCTATLNATGHLPSFSSDLAVPPGPVADAMKVFGNAWRARAAANTSTAASTSADEADACDEEWTLSDRVRDGLLQACAWWCSTQPDVGAALTSIGHSIAREGSNAGGILSVVQSADAARAAFRTVLDL